MVIDSYTETVASEIAGLTANSIELLHSYLHPEAGATCVAVSDVSTRCFGIKIFVEGYSIVILSS
jgi:hypothetical protein